MQQAIGIISACDKDKYYPVMKERAILRRNCPPKYQYQAFKEIEKVCSGLPDNISVLMEKVVYCRSSKRYYSIDIYIPKLRLGIELDGTQHDHNKRYDDMRDMAILLNLGISILRIKNKDIEHTNFKQILTDIYNHTEIKICKTSNNRKRERRIQKRKFELLKKTAPLSKELYGT